MKITKVYTRTGDKGETSLVGGVRIKKSDIRLEAYGTVDELSAHLGMLVAMLESGEEHDFLIRVQNNLFNVCTHLATDQSQTPLYPSLPGGTTTAAQAHICRTVCRRAERRIAALAEVALTGVEIQQYVNRLSDYLFVLAKIINFNAGVSEIIWQNVCK